MGGSRVLEHPTTVYGPVPSWRFGRSLGIDAVVGRKTCTFNCVYCQLGKTLVPIASPRELVNPVSTSDIRKDLQSCLDRMDLNSLDAITFSGSGEPTLNLHLGAMVECARELSRKKVPIILLTNSSLLHLDDVRENAAKFDIVCAKLDAGDQKSFRAVNRPVKGVSNLKRIVSSVEALRACFTGKLMIQCMFLRTTFGFANCHGTALESIVDAVRRVDPDAVQIDTPYRPGGEKFVRCLKVDELRAVAEKFMENFDADKLWTFGVHDMRGKRVSWRGHESVGDDVLALIRRRPCRIVDVADSLGISHAEVLENVSCLLDKRRSVEKSSNGDTYLYPTD